MKPCIICTLNTPIGLITITEFHKGVVRLDFDSGEAALADKDLRIMGRDRRFFDDATPSIPTKKQFFDSAMQICEYFAGTRKEFDLPIVISAPEDSFERKVYEQLNLIPYGTVISYAVLAARSSSPKAYRAAGNANAKNKIPIILPCHRVIAKDGTLGGYSGGLEIKRILLKLEKAPISF